MIEQGRWSKRHLMKSIEYLSSNRDILERGLNCVYEFGTYRGESLRLIENLFYAHNLPLKKSFGLDSFQGLPEESHGVPHFYLFNKGAFSDVTFLYPINGIYIKVWFHELCAKHIEEYKLEPACLVHIDCDLYCSARSSLDFMFENHLIREGTVVAYDEFKSVDPLLHGGEAKAHLEIADKYKVEFQEFFRNTYEDGGTILWQNAFIVKSIGNKPDLGLMTPHE